MPESERLAEAKEKMSEATLALVGARLKGEELRRAAGRLRLLDSFHKIQTEDDSIFIPLDRQLSADELAQLRGVDSHAHVKERRLPRMAEVRPRSLADALSKELSPNQLACLPKTFDVVGDLLVVDIPEDLKGLEQRIAKAALDICPNARSVWAKGGPVSGEYRTREHRWIMGERRSTTIHKENGCVFRVDLQKVFFSPRLAFERQRVSRQVGADETVVDMFSGVGPFAIQIAKSAGARVYAVEKNPDAFRLLCENVTLNKVGDSVTPLPGDAGELAHTTLKRVGNRIIMNLLEKSHEFVDAALSILSPAGGMLHFYTHGSDPRPLDEAVEKLGSCLGGEKRRLAVMYRRVVKPVAPREYLVVVDALVE